MVTNQLKLVFIDYDDKRQIKTFNITSTCTNQQIVEFSNVVAGLIDDWSTYEIYKVVSTELDRYDYD